MCFICSMKVKPYFKKIYEGPATFPTILVLIISLSREAGRPNFKFNFPPNLMLDLESAQKTTPSIKFWTRIYLDYRKCYRSLYRNSLTFILVRCYSYFHSRIIPSLYVVTKYHSMLHTFWCHSFFNKYFQLLYFFSCIIKLISSQISYNRLSWNSCNKGLLQKAKIKLRTFSRI